MDEEIIYERGVIRMTERQLFELLLSVQDGAMPSDIIDIRQPDSFSEEVDWDIWEKG